jgi:hypothetical protein
VRIVRTPPRGLVAALNAGCAVAQAPFLARMDADDICHPERLARQVERLQREPALAILGCGVELFGTTSASNAGMRAYVTWGNALLTHDDIVRDLYVDAPLVHPTVMMRRPALDALSGWRDFEGPEDYDLWLRAHQAGLRFARLPEILLRWRDGDARLTRSDARYRASCFQALKVEALLRGPLRDAAVAIWGAGPIGKSWARALAGRCTVAAFVDVHPRRLGARIQGAPVIDTQAVSGLGAVVHLAAVGQPGGRERIRTLAASMGLPEPLAVA